MSPTSDVLELLLPDAAPDLAVRARRLTTFLRLLANDARPRGAGTVRVNLERARGELERHRRLRLERALRDLLAHHLAEALGPESFARPPEPPASAQESWRLLEESRGDVEGLAELPAPGESAAGVAARLLEAAAGVSVLGEEETLWAALLRRAQAGPEEGALAFREVLESGPARARRTALAGLAACHLDRCDVRAARAVLARHDALVPTPWLRKLRVWVRLLCGEEPVLDPPDGPERLLPSALGDLRRRRPEWLPWLAGRVAPPRRGSDSSPEGMARSRREVGAAFLGVFVLRAGGVAHAVHLDAGPGLADQVPSWLEQRSGACGETRAPEHRLVVRAEAVIEHRRDRPLGGALSPERAASRALVPVPDGVGEVAGWVHVESEHHLLPCDARLERLARAWRVEVLEARDRAERRTSWSVRSELPAAPAPPNIGDPCGTFFHHLIEGLGMKLTQRSWWGFVSTVEGLRPVARGGGRLGPGRRSAGDPPGAPARGGSASGGSASGGSASGGARALDRAAVTGGIVRYEEPDPRVSLSSDAVSGVVLPVTSRGELTGLLCVESSRRRDFGDAAVRRLAERVRAGADALRVALFRAWHARRFGYDVHVPARGAFFDEVRSAARASAALVLIGPPGSGKDVVARWVHHESRSSGPLQVHAGGRLAPDRGLPDEPPEGTLLIQDVERLDPRLQIELARRLEAPREEVGDRSPGRMLLALERRPGEAAAAGRIPPVLARRLERLQLRVPPLEERREEIPELARVLLARFAAEERVPQPHLADGAMAALWRQPWEGNVRELENLVYQIVVARFQGEVGVAFVERLARRAGIELLRRVPSRRPVPAFVRSALRTTRTMSGSLNKTRAAAYLGWDPDTLVARMKELGLDSSVLADE